MRHIALLAAMGALAIAACSPQTASTPDATATDTPASPAATSQPTPSAPAGADDATGTPTSEITREQVVLPQPDDWVRGPDTAAVTFIEWGDFQ